MRSTADSEDRGGVLGVCGVAQGKQPEAISICLAGNAGRGNHIRIFSRLRPGVLERAESCLYLGGGFTCGKDQLPWGSRRAECAIPRELDTAVARQGKREGLGFFEQPATDQLDSDDKISGPAFFNLQVLRRDIDGKCRRLVVVGKGQVHTAHLDSLRGAFDANGLRPLEEPIIHRLKYQVDPAARPAGPDGDGGCLHHVVVAGFGRAAQ